MDQQHTDGGPAASVVITSRNRCAGLRQAIVSALAQTADVEVLVIDDASTDGTAAMVRQEFPSVRFFRDEQPGGYIVQRNRAAELARAPIIVSIDDDAQLASPRTVEQTLKDFDDERIGVVAIPYADLIPRHVVHQLPPDRDQTWLVFTYVGTAHAVRRSLFLEIGGYRPGLGARCEEADFCIRMLDAGYVTRLGRGDLIHHAAAPRDTGHNMYLQARNDLLHVWCNVPLRFLPLRVLKSTLSHLWVGLIMRHPCRVALGLLRGYWDMARGTLPRRPVRIETHRIDEQLRRRGPIPLRLGFPSGDSSGPGPEFGSTDVGALSALQNGLEKDRVAEAKSHRGQTVGKAARDTPDVGQGDRAPGGG